MPFKKGKDNGHFWKKGESGNPLGRPKSNLGKILSQYLQEKHGDKTREQWLTERLWAMAAGGNLDAIKFIWERLEGRIKTVEESESGGIQVTLATMFVEAVIDARKNGVLPSPQQQAIDVSPENPA